MIESAINILKLKLRLNAKNTKQKFRLIKSKFSILNVRESHQSIRKFFVPQIGLQKDAIALHKAYTRVLLKFVYAVEFWNKQSLNLTDQGLFIVVAYRGISPCDPFN